MTKYKLKTSPQFMSITKALSEENRVRILMFLRDGELCLCQIIEILDLSPSTVSKHMAVLHQAGLVESRKEGRWHYYRLSKKSRARTACSAIVWLQESLSGDRIIVEDAKKLRAVLLKDKEKLCKHYNS